MLVRTQGEASSTFAAIRSASREMSSQQVIYGQETMDQVVFRSLATPRFLMILLGVFAVLAMILASVGIYGVISYVVGQRTHEIGVRMALGAQRTDVLRLILGGRRIFTKKRVGIGLIAALGLTRLMKSLLYGVHAHDPLTFVGVASLLTLVALAACYLPARRAAKVDPIVALRYE